MMTKKEQRKKIITPVMAHVFLFSFGKMDLFLIVPGLMPNFFPSSPMTTAVTPFVRVVQHIMLPLAFLTPLFKP